MGRHAQIHIGTSGWNYQHWRGRFYPEHLRSSDWFAHYAKVFHTVEINNTFYHLPEGSVFDAWRRQSPPSFLYAVKANRFITHMKKLKDPEEPLERFFAVVRRLRDHLGPILYQLPPHWGPDVKRLNEFCRQLPRGLTQVVEFRERGWLGDEVYDVLERHGVCLCVHDLLKRHPRRVTGPAIYVRFHGAGAKYGGSYSRKRLCRWADWLREAAADGHEVYAYFNNDQQAHAVRNAQTLRGILGAG